MERLDGVAIETASGTAVSATCGRLPAWEPPPFVTANHAAVDGALRRLHIRGVTVVVGTR